MGILTFTAGPGLTDAYGESPDDLSQIRNHIPPQFDCTSISFTLEAKDSSGIRSGMFYPHNGYGISVWGYNPKLFEYYPDGEIGPWYPFSWIPPYGPDEYFYGPDENFDLISGSNESGEWGIYQLIASMNGNNGLCKRWEGSVFVDPSKGYYFQIGDNWNNVIYIGRGGQRFASAEDAQANSIAFGGVFNQKPVSDAGPNQSTNTGTVVNLDGSFSHDVETPSESLLYSWSFSSKPTGSMAMLSGSDTVTPAFTPDMPGDYVASLIVTDNGGLSSESDEVTISSLNSPPNAIPGPNQSTYAGHQAILDGSQSYDPDGDPLSFSWVLLSRPAGSTAILIDEKTATPALIPDVAGAYVVELIVNDGSLNSEPAQLTVMVITSSEFAQLATGEAMNFVARIAPSGVTTPGNQTALMNFLKQAILDLQLGDSSESQKKLQDAIARTDGCALRGSPDFNGGTIGHPPANDYINNCQDQRQVYSLLTDALTALSSR